MLKLFALTFIAFIVLLPSFVLALPLFLLIYILRKVKKPCEKLENFLLWWFMGWMIPIVKEAAKLNDNRDKRKC